MPDKDLMQLDQIEHIVVLMMENRSFDHMLGYLTLEDDRTEVDGLSNDRFNTSRDGTAYYVHHLESTALDFDPCHEGRCVDEQIGEGNDGFVRSYERANPSADPGVVMGYYNADDLPVYDHLAQEFTICDRWFSSVAGQTWPNRLYALTGHADGSRENKVIPLYNEPSLMRHLDDRGVPWRWYCHDFATLRLIDGRYRLGRTDHFYSFEESSIFETEDFLSHAAAGNLAPVSWVDPNFADFGNLRYSNDDHVPADLMAGQLLVSRLYQALVESPVWNRTLLVIVYDEHGGFYDHVSPPEAIDDSPDFRRYGCRVPAFIVSPWVRQGGVSHTLFDHTSILKTILLRFCRQADGTIPAMGARVAAANHLGGLLSEPVPRHIPPPVELMWQPSRPPRPDPGAGATPSPDPAKPSGFQRGLMACRRELGLLD